MKKPRKKILKLTGKEYIERFMKPKIPHVIKSSVGLDALAVIPQRIYKNGRFTEYSYYLDCAEAEAGIESGTFSEMLADLGSDKVTVLDWIEDNSCYCEHCSLLNKFA